MFRADSTGKVCNHLRNHMTMKRRIWLIACFLIFSVSVVKGTDASRNEEMENLVQHISELSSKVLEIVEPIAEKSGDDNTFFISFLQRNSKNETVSRDSEKKARKLHRMIVNNNFNGDKMAPSQVFVESGEPPKQPPSHNIQLQQAPTQSVNIPRNAPPPPQPVNAEPPQKPVEPASNSPSPRQSTQLQESADIPANKLWTDNSQLQQNSLPIIGSSNYKPRHSLYQNPLQQTSVQNDDLPSYTNYIPIYQQQQSIPYLQRG